jgi:hypothetical protein
MRTRIADTSLALGWSWTSQLTRTSSDGTSLTIAEDGSDSAGSFEIAEGTDHTCALDVIGVAATFRLLQDHVPPTRWFTSELVDLVPAGRKATAQRS